MAEWLKAAVLKTVRRKPRGFESLSLRQATRSSGAMAAAVLSIASAMFALASCAHSGPQRLGTITGAAAAVPIADLLSSPELHLGKDIAVKGIVAQVCQEMGCWFEVADGDKRLMVDLQMGRSFTVPKNAAGYGARVEGTFVREEGVLKIIGRGVELTPTSGT
jgi:uncharacterized protein DUF4920